MNTTTIAQKLSTFLLQIQLRFAAMMTKSTACLPQRKLKLLSCLFILFYFSLSTVITFRALQSATAVSSFKPQHMRVTAPLPAKQAYPVIVTKELYEQLQELKSQHERNGIHLSSGMLDSIAQLEKIYLSK